MIKSSISSRHDVSGRCLHHLPLYHSLAVPYVPFRFLLFVCLFFFFLTGYPIPNCCVSVICFLTLQNTFVWQAVICLILACPPVGQKQTSRDHHPGSLVGACVWHLGSHATKQAFNSWTDVHVGAGSCSVLFADTLFYWAKQIQDLRKNIQSDWDATTLFNSVVTRDYPSNSCAGSETKESYGEQRSYSKLQRHFRRFVSLNSCANSSSCKTKKTTRYSWWIMFSLVNSSAHLEAQSTPSLGILQTAFSPTLETRQMFSLQTNEEIWKHDNQSLFLICV